MAEREFTPLEALLRQCTIHITEVWGADGNTIIGMRATAEVENGDLAVVEREGSIQTAQDLVELFELLAVVLYSNRSKER